LLLDCSSISPAPGRGADASLHQVKECKCYADGAAAGPAAPGGNRDRGGAGRPVRDHAHTGPADRYNLVIDPSHLWLVIHKSIGHATELDRALGYEAAFDGTSFATPDKLGRLSGAESGIYILGDKS
jgi:hypothetical protein